MQLTAQQLSQSIADLSDEALIARLSSNDLTELAADVIQRELAARGIAAQSIPTMAPPAAESSPANMSRCFDFFLKRVLLFPVNAVRGTEPLWSVIVFGGPLVYGVCKLALLGIAEFAFTRRAEPHALPILYALLSAFVLAALWLAIALWRTASAPPILKYLMRFVAVVFFLNCLSAASGGYRLVRDHFPSAPVDTPSIMDSPRPH
jgi:hypothetical protein